MFEKLFRLQRDGGEEEETGDEEVHGVVVGVEEEEEEVEKEEEEEDERHGERKEGLKTGRKEVRIKYREQGSKALRQIERK